jgi:hypothetical protein
MNYEKIGEVDEESQRNKKLKCLLCASKLTLKESLILLY